MEAQYKLIEGIKCYAPELAFDNKDYPAGGFEKSLEIEKYSFWYRSRNRILKYLFNKFLGSKGEKKVLEIGCGTGYVLNGLSEFKNFRLSGAEIYLDGLKFAKTKLPEVDFIQLDATRIPFESEYDAIGVFDVIEHIEEDELVLQNIYKALKVDGYVFISVPQHMFLWSKTDEITFHKRRYNRKELVGKMKRAGFKVEFVSSFVFSLLPFMMVSRFINKYKKIDSDDTSNHPGKILNSAFGILVKVDEILIKAGISLPAGGSLMAVGKKA